MTLTLLMASMRPRNSDFSVIGRLATSTTPTAGGAGELSADAGSQTGDTVPMAAMAAMKLNRRMATQLEAAMPQDHHGILSILLSTIHHTSDSPRTICLETEVTPWTKAVT